MSDNSKAESEQDASSHLSCQHEGFLPVPLRDIPFEALEGLNLYLFHQGQYTLYRSRDLALAHRDVDRLIGSSVDVAYVPVKDHQLYYRTIEQGLREIVRDPLLEEEKKAEILYSTCIALVDQLYEEPPDTTELDRVESVSRSMVEMVIGSDTAFQHLFEVSNHDFYTATHMVNVCVTMVALGCRLGLDQEDIQNIGTGSLLHDIGKLFIPRELLNTRDKLTDEQFRVIRTHVQLGYDYLQERASLSDTAMAIVLEHHERLDGSGYPNELRQDAISLFGRMAGIVDTFEAMTSVRPYRRKSYTQSEVITVLTNEAPQKYDAELVDVFRNMLEDQLHLTCQGDPSDPLWTYSPLEFIERMKRVYFRLPLHVRVMRRAGDSYRLGPPTRMTVHNMSQSGVGILSPMGMTPGQNIHLTIPALEPFGANPLVAIVARCKDHADGWYTVGARFLEEQPEELIDHIKTVTFVTEELASAKT